MKAHYKNDQLETKLDTYLQLSKSMAVKPLTNAKTLLPIGAAMFGALSSMDAAIVYSGVQNVPVLIPVNFNQVQVNLDGVGGNDFEIQNNVVAGIAFIQANEVGAANFALNGFIGNVVGNYGYPNANAAGFVIGAGSPWAPIGVGNFNSLADNAANEAQYPNTKWETDGMTAFIGFRGVLNGGTKYGWIRVTRNTHTSWTIVDWAYENSGASIVAGATVSLVADLSLTKTASTTTPATGQTVTFTLVLSNAGPNPATNAEIKNIVPSGLTFVSGSMTGPGTYVDSSPAGTGLRWQNLTVPANGSVTLTFQATVAAASGNVVNFAEVQSSAEVDPDSTPGNGQ